MNVRTTIYGFLQLTAVAAVLSDDLTFAVCHSWNVQRISVSIVGKGENAEREVWSAEGEFEFEEGDMISFGRPPSSGENTLAPRPFSPARYWVNLRLDEIDNTGEVTSTRFAHFNGDLIGGDAWLTGRNTTRGSAC